MHKHYQTSCRTLLSLTLLILVFSLNMLISTQEGASYSESEYRAWLEDTGFKHIRKIDLKSDSSLIIDRKLKKSSVRNLTFWAIINAIVLFAIVVLGKLI